MPASPAPLVSGEEGEIIKVDIAGLKLGTRPEMNLRLEGGDVLFVPRRVIGRAIGDRIERGQINLWWGCWVGFNVVANLGLAESLVTATPINPIKPAYEIAAACFAKFTIQSRRSPGHYDLNQQRLC